MQPESWFHWEDFRSSGVFQTHDSASRGRTCMCKRMAAALSSHPSPSVLFFFLASCLPTMSAVSPTASLWLLLWDALPLLKSSIGSLGRTPAVSVTHPCLGGFPRTASPRLGLSDYQETTISLPALCPSGATTAPWTNALRQIQEAHFLRQA